MKLNVSMLSQKSNDVIDDRRVINVTLNRDVTIDIVRENRYNTLRSSDHATTHFNPPLRCTRCE